MSLIQQNMGAIYDGSQRLIAPVLNSTTATQNWEVGQEFILDGNLYKVTTAISSGSQIIVSGSSANCELADTVTEQINDVVEQTKVHTASGTTFAQLWTFINSLTNSQKDNLVLTINSPNRGGAVLRRIIANQYEGIAAGDSAMTAVVLNTTNYYFKRYTYNAAPSVTTESITSWSATYYI